MNTSILQALYRFCTTSCLLLLASVAAAFEAPPLTADEAAAAAADYQKYCALCHGADRQGNASDNAPSLRSHSLLRTGFPELILFTIAYGRRGTPMGGYFDEIGGPMNNEELYRLTRWLKEQVPVESIDLPREPVVGDARRGREIFAWRSARDATAPRARAAKAWWGRPSAIRPCWRSRRTPSCATPSRTDATARRWRASPACSPPTTSTR